MHKFDVHTHQVKSGSLVQIHNVFAQDLPYNDGKSFFSSGLHPWHIGKVDPEKCIHSIELASVQKNMLAIGECGLDRSTTTDFSIQEMYFRKQIEIAEKHSKPLIIHCVRAFPEIMKLKKEYKSAIPWIIHGFQGNMETTLQLIRHDFYFSIGEPFLNQTMKREIFSVIPLNRLFLETDDRLTSINIIYQLASQLLQTDEETLSEIISENYQLVFGSKNALNDNLT